jgi:hypothetical protein
MTRDDIISMAQEAEASFETAESMFKFAALVAAAEREACAKLCEDIDAEYDGEDVLATWCAAAIRARGENK